MLRKLIGRRSRSDFAEGAAAAVDGAGWVDALFAVRRLIVGGLLGDELGRRVCLGRSGVKLRIMRIHAFSSPVS